MENTATIRRTGKSPRPLAGCKRGKAQSAKKRTARPRGNGFLNHVFAPVWLHGGNRVVIEKQFFNSLSNYCTYFNVSLPDTGGLTFPQNIYRAWEIVKSPCGDKTCIILQDGKQQAVLATVETLDLNNCLFYIPVRLYWRLAKSAQRQHLAELVMCLFAYLHQQAGLPFYMDSGTFMDSQYNMLEQWINEVQYEEEPDENVYRKAQEEDIYELRQAGAHIHRLIDNPEWFTKMESVINTFTQDHPEETEWVEIAGEFLSLYQQYPKRTITDNIRTELLCPGEDERITPDMYTGFYWSGKDNLCDELDDMINNNFQEMPVMDEPMYIQTFDCLPEQPVQPFDYEDRLYDLIEKFRDLLNKYDCKHD
jgi:hypothetical protein